MAEEANVENLLSRFFCHKCKVEISGVLPDFTCPTCRNGFVEIIDLPENNDESDSSLSDVEVFQPLEVLNYVLTGLNDERFEDRLAAPGRRGGVRRRTGRNMQEYAAPVENLLQEFVVNLTSGGWGGQIRNAAGGPVLFLGNPGDYAWSREGLDAIVTQLLNQMDGTGPPPLAKEKIQKIPVACITQDQVDSNLQCSVCWEDFKVDEPVRKLSCEHVYHGPCIVPWLELHGTCPICRKTLSESDLGGEDGGTAGVASVHNSPLAAFFRAQGLTMGGDSDSSRASSTSSSSSGGPGNVSTSSSTSNSSMSTSSSNSTSNQPDLMDI